jgi:hypothetical protein
VDLPGSLIDEKDLPDHRSKGVAYMNDTPLEARRLSNGTTLHLVDASRPQTADRWIVVLEARMDIAVEAPNLPAPSDGGPTPEAVQQALGPQVTYVTRMERVFVPVEEKERLLETFLDEFCRNTVPYLSHPAFPGRFILKRYRETVQRRSWAPANGMGADEAI